jgi:predicted TIM-barrel fold metal-dependent hydrolase
VIDFHTHGMPSDMLPDEFYLARARALLSSGRTREKDVGRIIEKIRRNGDDPKVENLTSDLKAAGVDHAVLLGIDWGLLGDSGTGMHPSEQLAFGLEAVRDSAGFFSFVLAVDPRRPEAPQVVAEGLTHPEVIGVKLYPPAGFAPHSSECLPIYDLVIESGRFAMFHTGRQSYPFLLEHGRLEPYSAVQRLRPDLKIVLAHAGAPFWGEEAIEVAKGHPSTYLEVSGWHAMLDTDEERVRRMLIAAWATLGPDRVLFGSDHLSGARAGVRVPAIRAWWDMFVATAADAGLSVDDVDRAAQGLIRS